MFRVSGLGFSARFSEWLSGVEGFEDLAEREGGVSENRL